MANNGKVDFTDLTKFRENIEKSLGDEEQIQQFIESCAKELAARLLAKVVKRTPVGDYSVEIQVTAKKDSKKHKKGDVYTKKTNPSGKVGGTLRRGWTGEKQQNAIEYANSLKVEQRGKTYHIEIVNPVEYAPYVEFGHRQTPGQYVPAIGKRLKQGWVEGKFMLTISVDEVQRDAPRIIENKLKKKLGEVFK